jgi:thiol-disulfide isomerase/thioredoxin
VTTAVPTTQLNGATRVRGKRRRVLWIASAVGAVFAALLITLALVGTSNSTSPLKGKPAPALSGTVINGKGTVSLGQYSGKWVLVNFGASWCVPCREEMPQLADFAQVAARYNAVIVTVDMQVTQAGTQAPDVPGMRALMEQYRAAWPAIDAGTSATVNWGVSQIPTTFIVNPAGYVAGSLTDGVNAQAVEAAITKASGTS